MSSQDKKLTKTFITKVRKAFEFNLKLNEEQEKFITKREVLQKRYNKNLAKKGAEHYLTKLAKYHLDLLDFNRTKKLTKLDIQTKKLMNDISLFNRAQDLVVQQIQNEKKVQTTNIAQERDNTQHQNLIDQITNNIVDDITLQNNRRIEAGGIILQKQQPTKQQIKNIVQDFFQDVEDLPEDSQENMDRGEKLEQALRSQNLVIPQLTGVRSIYMTKNSQTGNNAELPFVRYETELFICPPQHKCFFKAVFEVYKKINTPSEDQKLVAKIESTFNNLVNQFTIDQKLKDFEMPRCKINKFSEICKLRIGVFDIVDNVFKSLSHSQTGIYDVNLTLQEGHYFLIKERTKAAIEAVKDHCLKIKEIHQLENKNISALSNLDFNCKEIKHQIQNKEIQKQIFDNHKNDVIIFDLETLIKEYQGMQIQQPYAYGFASLITFRDGQKLLNTCNEKEKVEVYELVKQQVTSSFNIDPKALIESFFSKIANKVIKSHKTEHIKKLIKKSEALKITLVGHNTSKFDSHIFFSQMIMKNLPKNMNISSYQKKEGSNQMSISFEYVCSNKLKIIFVFWDSCRFLTSSLKNLCVSFKIPIELSKIDLDIGELDNIDQVIQNKTNIMQYQINDITSLGMIITQLEQTFNDEFNLDIFQAVSISQISSIAHKNFCNENNLMLQSYKSHFTRKVLRQHVIRGGRVQTNKKYFKRQDHQVMMQFLQTQGYSTIWQLLDELTNFKENCEKNFYSDPIRLSQSFTTYYQKQFILTFPSMYKYFNQIDKNDILLDLDATSLYPSAMQDESFVWPNLESAKTITTDVELKKVKKNMQKLYYQNKNVLILKVDITIPQGQHFIACNVDVCNKKVYASGEFKNQHFLSPDLEQLIMRNNAIIDHVHEAVIWQENVENPFKIFVRNCFNKRQSVRKNNQALGEALKLVLNSTYGKQAQKPINTIYNIVKKLNEKNCNQDVQMISQINDRFLLQKHDKTPKSSQNDLFGCLILSYSKVLMNEFIQMVGGFEHDRIYASDTDSIYVEKQYAMNLLKSDKYGSNLGQIKNDYDQNGIIFGCFIQSKVKCGLLNDDGVLSCFSTFKGCPKKEIKHEMFNQLLDEKSVEVQIENPFAKKNGHVCKEVIVKKFKQSMMKQRSRESNEYQYLHLTQEIIDELESNKLYKQLNEQGKN